MGFLSQLKTGLEVTGEALFALASGLVVGWFGRFGLNWGIGVLGREGRWD